jgi:hypothetical protein
VIGLLINALLIHYIFDPIVNETKTIKVIIADIKAVLCNLKVIIFLLTVLLCSTVGKLGNKRLGAIVYDKQYRDFIRNA